MATIWGHGNGFFRRRKNKIKIGFSKSCSDHFRGPNRRILGQGIGQNLVWTIFEKVQKSKFFSTFWKNSKKLLFFDGFLSTGYASAAGPSGDCSMEERRAVEMYGKMWRQVPHGEQYQDCFAILSILYHIPQQQEAKVGFSFVFC